MELGYWLSCEEHDPTTLVAHAVAAERAGFGLAIASDHFHPWIPAQGQAPFVWSVLGAIACATDRITLATGVSAPLRRVHPVTLAHAASTIAAMSRGRFVLGLGIGERLNEHITADPWPRPGVRRRMLQEAIVVLRQLLAGDDVDHEGEFFTVEHARLYTRAATPPPLWVAVGGPRTARVAGEQADGMLGLEPTAGLVETFERAGGAGKPVVAQLHVCLADSVDDAVRTARRRAALRGGPTRALRVRSRGSRRRRHPTGRDLLYRRGTRHAGGVRVRRCGLHARRAASGRARPRPAVRLRAEGPAARVQLTGRGVIRAPGLRRAGRGSRAPTPRLNAPRRAAGSCSSPVTR
jgi:coenzyme F420-dependent glucose-6-phosphate dehydrogenase